MAEGADDVRYDMEMTRRRMADTLAQIEDRVTTSVDGVKSKLDVTRLVRDHPWPALAVALAAGYALAATGADAAAAGAVADASVDAAESVKEAASNVVEHARERFARDDEADAPADAEPSWLDRISARVADEIAAMFSGPAEKLSRDIAGALGAPNGRPTYSLPVDAAPLGSAGEVRL